ncbi:unnamed protein product, partial [marine sediment metagenome]
LNDSGSELYKCHRLTLLSEQIRAGPEQPVPALLSGYELR